MHQHQNNYRRETNRGKFVFIAIGIALILIGQTIQAIHWLFNR